MKAKIIILGVLVLTIIFVWQKNSKQPETISVAPTAPIIDMTAEDLSSLKTIITDDEVPHQVLPDAPVAKFEKPEFQGSTGPVELLTQ